MSATSTRNFFATSTKPEIKWFSSINDSQQFLSTSRSAIEAEYAAVDCELKLFSTLQTTFARLVGHSLSFAVDSIFATSDGLIVFCVHNRTTSAAAKSARQTFQSACVSSAPNATASLSIRQALCPVVLSSAHAATCATPHRHE